MDATPDCARGVNESGRQVRAADEHEGHRDDRGPLPLYIWQQGDGEPPRTIKLVLTTAHREDLIGRSEPPAPAVQDRPSVLDLLQRVPEAE